MNSNNKSSGGRQARKGNTPHKKNSFRKDFKKPRTTPQKVDVGGIRLNKFISNSGICSRREADTYIEHGSVTVNGKLVTEMGYKVQKTDEVRFDGTSITPEKTLEMSSSIFFEGTTGHFILSFLCSSKKPQAFSSCSSSGPTHPPFSTPKID